MKIKYSIVKPKIKINGLNIKKDFVIIAGPCSIESYEQLEKTAKVLVKNNIKIIRASAYKPRTNPYSFQGLEEKGLEMLNKIGKKYDLATESEITDSRQVKRASELIDVLRVGARNMQNYELLKELSKVKNPIILKNGFGANIEEFLGSVEYLLANGKENIILCYRGIRTFENSTRFTFDPLMIKILKEKTNLPVIADPSHASGRNDLVLPLSKAAIVCGTDGLIVETHPNPKKALSDNEQQIPLNEFPKFVKEINDFVRFEKQK
ncbi:MAG: 3-deoxy-7-phosphoheptulonate synthase [Candidatus ainarchaeum sp.]|nr:3-deoxy-7-phosphoheptulonate synthase [Candidatus ainarchaeum sp.]